MAPCSLLTAREVSRVLDVHARVKHAPSFCTYQGTRNHVFRAVVVTPQHLTATVRPRPYQTRYGQIVEIAGVGYHGQAQDDPPTTGAAGLEQSKAQIVSGDVLVQVFVSYHGLGLRGVSQLREVATLADHAGRRLARAR